MQISICLIISRFIYYCQDFMDRPSQFNNTDNPSSNSLNYQPAIYSPKEKATFTQVDSRTHLPGQQAQPYAQQQSLASYLQTRPQNGAQLYQQYNFLQANGDELASGTNKKIQGGGSQRYRNRYSFKRNQTAKQLYTSQQKSYLLEKTNTIRSNEIKEEKINTTAIIQREQTNAIYLTRIKQLQIRIKQQELLFAKIRQTAYNRKIQCERNADKDYACLSTLVQIYNLTIINTQITPLPSIIISTRPVTGNTNNISTNFIPSPINIVIPPAPVRPPIPTYLPIYIPPAPPKPIVRPIQLQPVKPQPPKIIFPQPQPNILPQPKPTIINPQPINVLPPKDVEVIDKSQQYIKEIKQLRIKIQQLQSQRIRFAEQVKFYQHFESTSQETMSAYKEQVQHLRQKITQLSSVIQPAVPTYPKSDRQIRDLKQQISIYMDRQKQYENQLIQAQNHIIHLQNSTSRPTVTCQHSHYEIEIKTLRETIASYNQHIQSIELQMEEYKKYIIQKDQDITILHQQNNALNIYIQQSKHNQGQSGIDPNEYYGLLNQFGKKDLQVIILFTQIERLQIKNKQVREYLEKAQIYIAQMHQQQSNSSSGTNNDNYKQLEIALQKEYQNHSILKKTYQVEVERLTIVINQLSKQIQIYEKDIATYKHDYQTINVQISQLNQQISVHQLQINNYKVQIQRITRINIELTRQITVFQTQIVNLTTQINQITLHSTTIQGVDPEIYNAAIIDLGKKQLQVIILLEEINRLNVLRIELTKHLQHAENYIFGAQQYIKQLQNKFKVPAVNPAETEGYKSKIKDLQASLTVVTQKISMYQSKESTYLKQIKELEFRYNTLVVQSEKSYQQLLVQKNSLSSKITTLTQRSTMFSNANILIQKSISLHQTNKQLNIQIAQITQQLLKAQSYIESNSQKWQQFILVQKQLAQKLKLVELLSKEIQLTKSQNIQLNDRIIELQGLIAQFYSITTTQTTVVTSQEQAIQVNRSATNTQTLYNQAQSKLALARSTISFQQQTQLKKNLQSYQLENQNIKKRLAVTEDQKKELILQFQKLHADYVRVLEQNERQVNEKNGILEALAKAEDYILEMSAGHQDS